MIKAKTQMEKLMAKKKIFWYQDITFFLGCPTIREKVSDMIHYFIKIDLARTLTFLLAFPLFCSISSLMADDYIGESDTAYRTALALNYAHAALFTITDYNDRIVLDQEYKNILSNINLSQIDDKEVIDLLRRLLDTLNHFTLTEEERGYIENIYESKINDAFYSAFTSSVSMPKSSAGLVAQPHLLAFVLVVNIGDQMINYRNKIEDYRAELDDSVWELKKEQAEKLNDLRKQFLLYYWQLMRKHEIPDYWRITEDQFSLFLGIIKDDDKSRRYRRLDKIKEQFEAYPPFWYYYGHVAQELELYDVARTAYDYVINRHIDYFRDDKIYSSVLLNRVQLYSTETDRKEVLELLDKVVETSPLDGRKMLAVALYYGQFGLYQKATRLAQGNIDEGFMLALNLRILAELNVAESSPLSINRYQEIIGQMMAESNFKNQDILYLIGRTDDPGLVDGFLEHIECIDLEYEHNFYGDSLLVTMPNKWVTYSKAGPLFPVLEYIEGNKEPDSISVDETNRTVTFVYDDFLPLDRFPEKSFPFEVQIQLPGRDFSATLVVKYYTDQANDDSPSMVDKASSLLGVESFFEKQDLPRMKTVPIFSKYELRTTDHCYRFLQGKLVPGCNGTNVSEG